MSEPTPQPGWYPVSQYQQRYWDGTSWTEQHAPLQGPTQAYAPPPKGRSPLTWILLTLGLIFVLGVGGCVAYVAIVGNQLSQTYEDVNQQMETP